MPFLNLPEPLDPLPLSLLHLLIGILPLDLDKQQRFLFPRYLLGLLDHPLLGELAHLDALPDLPLDLLPLPVLLRLQRRPLLLQLPLPLLQLPVQLVLLRPQQLLPLSLTLFLFLVELEDEGLAVLGFLLDDRDARLRRLGFVLSCGGLVLGGRGWELGLGQDLHLHILL